MKGEQEIYISHKTVKTLFWKVINLRSKKKERPIDPGQFLFDGNSGLPYQPIN